MIHIRFMLSILIIFTITKGTKAQVAVNQDNSNPDPSAMLDVQSTDKGMLVPRMSTVQREAISNAANGLLVWDSDTQSFWFFKGTKWIELVDRANSTWSENSSGEAYTLNTKVGIGNINPSDKLQVDAGAAEPALRVRQDGTTRLRVHSNGGTSLGENITPPDNGLLVSGTIEPRSNIVTDQNLLIESTGTGSFLQLKTNPNYLFLDAAGLFGFSQDVLIMETAAQSNKLEMNTLGLSASSVSDLSLFSATSASGISMNSQGISSTSQGDLIYQTTGENKSITLKVGEKEIVIDDDDQNIRIKVGSTEEIVINEQTGTIHVNSGGSDLTIKTEGGNLKLDSGNGDIMLNSGLGDINMNGTNMDFTATGTMDMESNNGLSIKSITAGIDLQSLSDMTLNTNADLTLNSLTKLTIDAGTTLDLDGTIMTLDAGLINLNGGIEGAGRKGDIVSPTTNIITTGSSTVLIGD